MLPQIPMTPTPPKPAALTAGSVGKTLATHAAAIVLGIGGAIGGPMVLTPNPSSPAPLPIEKKVEAAPKPILVPVAPKVEVSPYEIKIRAAVEVDPHSHAVFIKRLVYLYRGVLRETLAGKSEQAIQASFKVEEKKLDLVDGLPVLRPIIVEEWISRYPANAPTEVIRASNVKFWRETIGILERLP